MKYLKNYQVSIGYLMEQKTADQIRLAHRSLDFIGKGNVWVENSLIGQASVAFTQSLIARALEGTASGQLEIVVFDDALRGIAAPFQEPSARQ